MLNDNFSHVAMTIEEMKENRLIYFKKNGKVDGRCKAKRDKVVDENGNDLRVNRKSVKEDEQHKQVNINELSEKLSLYNSKMVKSWQVSWNKDIYDYHGIIEAFNTKQTDIIYQSKGMARMREDNLPKIEDIVYVSCNKLKIMKCKVISDFIIGNEEKNEEKDDIYNKGSPRTHTNNKTYLKMKIIEIYNRPTELKGCQRTWVTYRG